MITIEEKLNVFTKLVLEKVQQEFDEKLMEINQKNNEVIEKHRAAIDQTSKKLLEDLTKKGEAKKNKMISKAKLEKKRKILHKKQELIDRLMENVGKKAMAFTDDEAYQTFFHQSISKVLSSFQGEEGIQLFVTTKDADRFGDFIYQEGEKAGFTKEQMDIAVSLEDIVGGIVVVNRQRTLRIDASIQTVIEEHRQLIGQKLYDAFKEAGDIDE
ncbi:MAG: V-type ATP synthase subunit E [Bacillota bacterium]